MIYINGLVFPILLRRLWLPLLSSTQQVFFPSLRLFFLLPSPHPLSGVSDIEAVINIGCLMDANSIIIQDRDRSSRSIIT